MGVNIQLRLSEEGEQEVKTSGPTLMFVLEEKEKLLEDEREQDELTGQSQRQQVCTSTAGSDRTEPCSADSPQTQRSNRGPDTNP